MDYLFVIFSNAITLSIDLNFQEFLSCSHNNFYADDKPGYKLSYFFLESSLSPGFVVCQMFSFFIN